MRPFLLGLAALAALLVPADPAAADWSDPDGANMLVPQHPDPQGWDVELFRHELADDWQAVLSQPITEVHFWTSWYGDAVGIPEIIQVRFYADAGGTPGNLLWSRVFAHTEVTTVSPAGSGLQGWYVPEAPQWIPGDHMLYQQINITGITEPFTPAAGTVYWLSLLVDWSGIQAPIGWKTSLDTFGACAVWDHWYLPGWAPLTDPAGLPLQLAFVVGPGQPVATEAPTWAGIKALYR